MIHAVEAEKLWMSLAVYLRGGLPEIAEGLCMSHAVEAEEL